MTTTLLERADDRIALWKLIEETGGELDGMLEVWLAETENNLAEKVDSYRVIIEDLTTEADRLRSRSQEFREAAVQVENVLQRLKDRIKIAMQKLDTDELAGRDYRFKMSRVNAKLVIDEGNVPPYMMIANTVLVPDKERIRKLLDNGETLEYARLEPVHQLRISINKGSVK